MNSIQESLKNDPLAQAIYLLHRRIDSIEEIIESILYNLDPTKESLNFLMNKDKHRIRNIADENKSELENVFKDSMIYGNNSSNNRTGSSIKEETHGSGEKVSRSIRSDKKKRT